MPRPLNKIQLRDVAQKEYQKLDQYLSILTPKQLSASPAPGEWSVKDILVHLYEWQQMFFLWYETGLSGETPTVPAPGYKWNQLPALNQAIYEKYRALPLEEVLALFRASHQKTVKLMESLSEADLTTPGLYGWMNENTLMAYINANTGSHYRWAVTECKKSSQSAGMDKEMESREFCLQRVDETVADLLCVYRQVVDPGTPVYELWTAKDVLAHLTFWHESFARNVSDLVNGVMPTPLKGRFIDLNQGGVDAMKSLTLAQVLERFEAAHAIIRGNILNPALALIPYKKGSRDYTPEEHLDIIRGHIREHLQDVNKALAA